MSGMTDADYLDAIANGRYQVIESAAHHKERLRHIAARLRGDGEKCKCIDCGGSESAHSDSCDYMRDLHGEQGQAVAWIKPDWQNPEKFDGTSPVCTYPQRGWVPLYTRPQPVADDAVRASLREMLELRQAGQEGRLTEKHEPEIVRDARAALSTQPAPSAPCYPPHDSAECKRCHPDAPSEKI